MELPPDLPIVDHHAHLSPNAEGIEAGRRFEAAGGTHLFVATQNYTAAAPITLDDYRVQFETTERLARRIEAETRVRVPIVLAPYPVDLLRQIDSVGLVGAVELQNAALDLAGAWVQEQRAVALGEVGRPHFAVPPELREPIEAVLRHALEVARDADCPVVVHSEELDAPGFRALASLASSASFPVQRIVKHYARSVVPPSDRLGIVPSYLARRDLVEAALADTAPWFFETDFLDDPARPGAVLDITTVPKRAKAIAARGPEGVERLWRPFSESVRAVYRFEPSVTPRGVG